jgi:anti-sigma regulatory factor (Ser/Thr protein kinase)
MTRCAGTVRGPTVPALAEQEGAGPATHFVLRLSALDLGALPGSVPCARVHTRAVLRAWGLNGMIDAAQLVVSELVTNAVVAAADAAGGAVPAPVRLRLSAQIHGVRIQGVQIEVWDVSTALPVCGRDAPLDEPGGWGLVLVEALSGGWGSYRTRGGGKVVWAVLVR